MTGLVWTRQPQTGLRVNRANPLARGLVRLIIFHQGQPYDLVTNERLTVVGTAFSPAFTPDGAGIQNTAESAYWTLPLRTETSPASFAMGWVGQHAGGTTPITVRDATSSGGTFVFRRITSQWGMRLGGTDYTAAGTFNTATPYRALVSGGASTGKLWVNGALVINGGTPGPSGFAGPWYIHQNGIAGNGPTATTHLLAIWDRTVTDIEGQSFTANPWQLVAPRRRPVFGFTVTAGGHATSGDLAADAATVAGSATHLTLHTSTGALAADAATVSGSAAHLTLHTTTGALSAGAATVAGSAVHPHTTTGSLTADAATVSGSADHSTAGAHAASGALSADAATVSGSAAHLTLHATTGALSAGAAAVAGAAAHLAVHTATGALTASSAVVSGSAAHTGAGAVIDVPATGGGGWAWAAPRKKHRFDYLAPPTREQMAERVRKQREALGILPKTAQKRIETAVKKEARRPEPDIAPLAPLAVEVAQDTGAPLRAVILAIERTFENQRGLVAARLEAEAAKKREADAAAAEQARIEYEAAQRDWEERVIHLRAADDELLKQADAERKQAIDMIRKVQKQLLALIS